MQLIKPNWPAPKNIHAYTTTRHQGYSHPPYESLNLGSYINDEDQYVAQNRELLEQRLDLPSNPIWLKQVHSNQVINIDQEPEIQLPQADAAYATLPHRVCVVTTADCLPVLVCNREGTKVASIHAGWRGLAEGVIENTIGQLDESSTNLYVWLGPAIGPERFEVGEDVVSAFSAVDPQTETAFVAMRNVPGKWLANLYLLARQRLKKLGVNHIYGGQYCTYTDDKNFYSYRRDQGKTGRMATLIWLSV